MLDNQQDKKYIFVVGKFSPHSTTPEIARELGYKAGLLLDKGKLSTLSDNHRSRFDRIIELDFNDLDREIDRLEDLQIRIAGLVCTYENYVIAKAKIAHRLKLPSISIKSANLATDKLLMRQAFIDYDTSITPNFAHITNIDEAINFANTHGYPVIIKPTNLVKSLLVLKCANQSELEYNFNQASSNIDALYKKYNPSIDNPKLIIEEYIDGPQYTIAAYVNDKGQANFCSGIVSIVKAGDIGVDDNFLYKRQLPDDIEEAFEADITASVREQLFETAQKGIKALEMTSTPAHIELIYSQKGAKLIEIGPRTGGYRPRMFANSYAISLDKQEVLLALGKPPTADLNNQAQAYTAVYEIFANQVGRFSEVEHDIDNQSVLYHRITPKLNDITGPAKDGYKAAVIVIISAKNKDEFNKKCSQVDKMKVVVRP